MVQWSDQWTVYPRRLRNARGNVNLFAHLLPGCGRRRSARLPAPRARGSRWRRTRSGRTRRVYGVGQQGSTASGSRVIAHREGGGASTGGRMVSLAKTPTILDRSLIYCPGRALRAPVPRSGASQDVHPPHFALTAKLDGRQRGGRVYRTRTVRLRDVLCDRTGFGPDGGMSIRIVSPGFAVKVFSRYPVLPPTSPTRTNRLGWTTS